MKEVSVSQGTKIKNGELYDHYVDDSHLVWSKTSTGDDDYFDEMDNAPEKDAVVEKVA